jgi:glycosyltransferase involved in cell wall biosynthesis
LDRGIGIDSLSKNRPLVSVIIPTLNSQKYLEKCLKSIQSQTYDNIEIIVIDNYSSDKTIEIAREYTSTVFKCGPERSSQINFGVKKCSGKYVYRVDSDFVLDKNLIELAVDKCENEKCDAVCIQNFSDPTISFWSRVRKLERDCYAEDDLNIAAAFFRREIFEALNGFDEDLVAGEDYDLHNRILKSGYHIARIGAVELHLGEPLTLKDIARKHYYYGKTLVTFVDKNPDRASSQLSPLRPAFAKSWRKFCRQPDVTMGFFVYQFVRYFSAGMGYLVAYKFEKRLTNTMTRAV